MQEQTQFPLTVLKVQTLQLHFALKVRFLFFFCFFFLRGQIFFIALFQASFCCLFSFFLILITGVRLISCYPKFFWFSEIKDSSLHVGVTVQRIIVWLFCFFVCLSFFVARGGFIFINEGRLFWILFQILLGCCPSILHLSLL